MKRLVYYIAVLASTAMAMLSCTDELQETIPLGGEESVCGEKTTLEFALDFGEKPIMTKALTENAQIKNIYVSVFDGSGYKLSEYVEAVPNTKAGDNNRIYYYSAELTVADTTRILHIIANAPKKLDYGSENSVIGALYTDLNSTDTGFDFKESYWARVELPKIPKKPEADDPNYSTKMSAYNAILDKLNGVKLIRNYSKVTLKSSAGNFTPKGFWFVNYPDRGTVAPYNRNTGSFMGNYLDFTSAAAMEGTGENQGNYQGFMLATTKYITPETFDETPAGGYCSTDASGQAVGYIYEREKALSSPMYLIVKGDYTDKDTHETTADCFYKIAMQDGAGDFYAMLRNFNYLVDIESVSRAGKPSAAEALRDAPSGDISVNVDFKDLTNISDGKSRISVSATTVMLVGEVGDGLTYKDFWYKYEPDIEKNAGSAYNGTDTGGASYYVTIDGSSYGESGELFTSFERNDSDTLANYRYMKLVTNPITSVPKHQTLVITGHSVIRDGDGTRDDKITRMVDFILRPYLTMKLKCGPNTDTTGNGYVEKGKDKPVELSIGIETGLPASIFPLEFSIEAENMTLTPNNDNLPARTGISTIKGKSGSSFWFIKSVSWDEYQSATADTDGNKYFDCHLKTNTSVSATDIYVSQQYFAQNHVKLTNFTPLKFTSTTFSSVTPKVGDNITVNFTISGTPEDGKVTVALYGFDPGTGENGLTYVGNSTIDGKTYELYEYAVGSGVTSGSFKIKPFQSGEVFLRLDAFKFTGCSKNLYASEGTYPVYLDASRTDSAADDLITGLYTDYTDGSYQPVIGQPCTITVYVANGGTGTVTINGANATRKNSGTNPTKKIDGTTYYAYYINNYSSPTSGVNDLRVNFGDGLKGIVQIPVWDISLDTSLSSAPFDTGKYYVIQNSSTGWYIYNNNTFHSYDLLKTNLDARCLVQFSETGSPCYIKFTRCDNDTQYYLGDRADRPRLHNDNDRNWNFNFISTGVKISAGNTGTYYLKDNNGTIQGATGDNGNNIWTIYNVTIVEP